MANNGSQSKSGIIFAFFFCLAYLAGGIGTGLVIYTSKSLQSIPSIFRLVQSCLFWPLYWWSYITPYIFALVIVLFIILMLCLFCSWLWGKIRRQDNPRID